MEEPDKVLFTEYIFREGNSVVGVTLTDSGRIQELSEERYIDGKIVEYFWAWYNERSVLLLGGYEEYSHDEQGLIGCEWLDITFGLPDCVQRRSYRFIREDGWLKSYFNTRNPDIIYTPGVKRLALPPYFV
jgi:hypothetical protein